MGEVERITFLTYPENPDQGYTWTTIKSKGVSFLMSINSTAATTSM